MEVVGTGGTNYQPSATSDISSPRLMNTKLKGCQYLPTYWKVTDLYRVVHIHFCGWKFLPRYPHGPLHPQIPVYFLRPNCLVAFLDQLLVCLLDIPEKSLSLCTLARPSTSPVLLSSLNIAQIGLLLNDTDKTKSVKMKTNCHCSHYQIRFHIDQSWVRPDLVLTP